LQTAQLTTEVFSTLLALIKSAGLEEAVRSNNGLTVFAPTNEAFAAIDADTLAVLTNPANVDLLRDILLGHVTTGDTSMLMNGTSVTTLAGRDVPVSANMDNLYFGAAQILDTTAATCGGTIVTINAVVVPSEQPTAELECDGQTDCDLASGFLNGDRAEISVAADTVITPPAGMTGPITLTIDQYNPEFLEINSTAVIRLGPAGTTFNPPIQVCISVAAIVDPEEELTIAHSTDEGITFTELMDVTVNGTEVCGYTSSFSIFAATYKSQLPIAEDDDDSSSTSLIAILVLAGLGLLLGLIYGFTNKGCCSNDKLPDLEMGNTK
jgi:hypothetical protein